MKKKIEEFQVKRTVKLFIAGHNYTYVYNSLTGEVCTPEFPDIPIEKIYICEGHFLTHDSVRQIIEEKLNLPPFEVLKDLI